MTTNRQQLTGRLRTSKPAQFGCWMILALLWGLSTVPGLCSDGDRETMATELEYHVKAGFLFNFVKFVEWPTNAPGAPDKFLIGIMDDGKVYPVMAGKLSGKRVGDIVIETVRCKPGDDLKRYAMIFMTRSQAARTEEMRKSVAGAPVLTVGEFDRFAERGGCINFVRKGENIRFEVNLAAAERAGLKISSKIAGMAVIIRSEEDKK